MGVVDGVVVIVLVVVVGGVIKVVVVGDLLCLYLIWVGGELVGYWMYIGW